MNDFAAAMAPKSDQINALDLIAGDMTITITGVKVTPGTEQPVAIGFQGSIKVWRPCKTTGRILMEAWGADTSVYPGRSVQLYLDPKVKWGGMEVGGIRIRALTHMESDMRTVTAESKQVRRQVTIKRLTMAAPSPAAIADTDGFTRDEARTAARKGTDAFKAWYAAHPDKRADAKPIMVELKGLCDAADMPVATDDPFGLPELTEAQVAAGMADAALAARGAQE